MHFLKSFTNQIIIRKAKNALDNRSCTFDFMGIRFSKLLHNGRLHSYFAYNSNRNSFSASHPRPQGTIV